MLHVDKPQKCANWKKAKHKVQYLINPFLCVCVCVCVFLSLELWFGLYLYLPSIK